MKEVRISGQSLDDCFEEVCYVKANAVQSMYISILAETDAIKNCLGDSYIQKAILDSKIKTVNILCENIDTSKDFTIGDEVIIVDGSIAAKKRESEKVSEISKRYEDSDMNDYLKSRRDPLKESDNSVSLDPPK